MTRPVLYAFFLFMFLVPSLAFAGSHVGIGAALDGFFPLYTEMYGSRMVDNSWGRDMFGKDWSSGEDRVHFVGPNRYSMIFSPALAQTYFWDWGLGIELTEQIQYLHFAPNKDVDITFDRFMIPMRLTVAWTFFTTKKVRPFAGVGASLNYVVTRVAGKDLFDQRRNPDYYEDDSDDADSAANADDEENNERAFLITRHEWGLDGWYPGVHGVIGVRVPLTEELMLNVAARYEALPIESIDVAFVSDGDEQWHWEKRKLEGDAGGLGASVGVLYWF